MTGGSVCEVYLPGEERTIAFAPCMFIGEDFDVACIGAPRGVVFALTQARAVFARIAEEALRWD